MTDKNDNKKKPVRIYKNRKKGGSSYSRGSTEFSSNITDEAILEHYKILAADLRYIADEFNKRDTVTALLLYVVIQSLREGSMEELLSYMEAYMEERKMRIENDSWPYGEYKPK